MFLSQLESGVFLGIVPFIQSLVVMLSLRIEALYLKNNFGVRKGFAYYNAFIFFFLYIVVASSWVFEHGLTTKQFWIISGVAVALFLAAFIVKLKGRNENKEKLFFMRRIYFAKPDCKAEIISLMKNNEGLTINTSADYRATSASFKSTSEEEAKESLDYILNQSSILYDLTEPQFKNKLYIYSAIYVLLIVSMIVLVIPKYFI